MCVSSSASSPIPRLCPENGTHDDPLRLQRVSVPREPLPERVRILLAHLVLPHHHRPVQRPRVREDPRDVFADVRVARDEGPRRAVCVDRPRHVLHLLRHLAAQGQREVELHPQADVDEGVRNAELLDEVVNVQFLPDPESA